MRRSWLSGLIWLVAAAGAGWLWWHTRGPREPFPGVAGEPPVAIAATVPGRVAEVAAQVGDVVEAGAVLVRLDASAVDAEVAVGQAELAAALAEVEAEVAQRAEERRKIELELRARTAQARSAIEDVRSRQAASRAELRSLATALGRIRGVAERGLARGDQVADLESRQARLQGEVRYGPGAVDAWQGFTQELEAALAALDAADGDALLGPARARAELARKRVDALVLQRGTLQLKTPQAGRVARLLVRPGAVVQAGQPLVEVVEPEARAIHAWMPEDRSRLLAVGATVAILPRDRMGEPHTGTVERVGPALEPLPNRFWFENGTPRYGRPLLIRTEIGLLVGEAVQVAPR